MNMVIIAYFVLNACHMMSSKAPGAYAAIQAFSLVLLILNIQYFITLSISDIDLKF